MGNWNHEEQNHRYGGTTVCIIPPPHRTLTHMGWSQGSFLNSASCCQFSTVRLLLQSEIRYGESLSLSGSVIYCGLLQGFWISALSMCWAGWFLVQYIVGRLLHFWPLHKMPIAPHPHKCLPTLHNTVGGCVCVCAKSPSAENQCFTLENTID